MTRVTDFGRKRTYVQAGFPEQESSQNIVTDTSQAGSSTAILKANNILGTEQTQDAAAAPPLKKKRKRTPKSKRDGYAAQRAAEAGINLEAKPNHGEDEGDRSKGGGDGDLSPKSTLTRVEKKQKRNLARRMKVLAATEARRLKRIKQKNSDTVCFACREKGHAAKDCSTIKKSEAQGEGGAQNVVGICYRCGSKKHSLSRCRKPSNPADPFPHASCFVCNGKGHLASACPQNKSKGVYPNGGSCKLCGDTSHLARNCGIREKVTDPTTVLGTGREAGADEDDFHTFKRRTTEVEHDEKQETKLKEMLDVRSGALSGAVKASGNFPPPARKKVVVFT